MTAKVVLNSRYGKSVTREVNSFFAIKREAAKALARGYKPLRFRRRDFRLLTLLPDDQDGIPIFTLEIFTLDGHPPYEALSYT
jgi:hypothetical protein